MSDWTLLSHPVQMAILVNGHAEGSYPLPSAGWRLTRCFHSKLTCLQRESHEFVSEARGQEDNEIQTSPVTSAGKKKHDDFIPTWSQHGAIRSNSLWEKWDFLHLMYSAPLFTGGGWVSPRDSDFSPFSLLVCSSPSPHALPTREAVHDCVSFLLPFWD